MIESHPAVLNGFIDIARAEIRMQKIEQALDEAEANYNMIDGLMNNTPKKKDKNAPRRSVLKRLRKHQQKIASQGKGQPQQQRAVEEHHKFS